MNIRKRNKILAATITLLFVGTLAVYFALPAHGAVKVWKGTVSSSWNTSGNWSPSGVPGVGDVATFDNTCTSCNVTLDASPNVLGFDIQSTYSGTITQSGSNTITIGSSGWTQAGGTFTGGTGAMTFNGAFSLSGGTFTATSGTITTGSNWTYSGGTLNPNGGTVVFANNNNTQTITGSQTLVNVTFANPFIFWYATTLTTGTTLTVTGNLNLTLGYISGGTIEAKGNITHSGSFGGGTGTLLIDGTGDQTLTGSASTGICSGVCPGLPNVVISKPSGNLFLSGTINCGANWTYTSMGTGTLVPGTSTVIFYSPNGSGNYISGSHTLNNITFVAQVGCWYPIYLSSSTITATGDVNLYTGVSSGTLSVQGNVTRNSCFDGGGDMQLQFTGGRDQVFTNNGSPNTTGNITINKTGGTVSLGSNADWNAASQSLTITSGTLSMGNYNLSIGSGGLSIGSAGALRGFGTGDLTLAGNVSNSGEITLRSNRSCGVTDQILIRSSNTVQRNWTGSGTFILHDVNASYQTGSAAITAYSSTNAGNNGANWNFTASACPALTPSVSVSSGSWTIGSGSLSVY